MAGAAQGAREGLGLQSIALDPGRGLAVSIHTDSSAAQGLCNQSGVGKIRHWVAGQLWAQERLRDHTITPTQVWGK